MPTYDTIIRGGTLIDGLMTPRREADVAIKDGRIVEISRRLRSSDAAEVLDASGQIVAPGFVDLHTHYDPYFFFDPWCTLSGWHGVTSVVIGNCGFGFAPAKPQDQEYLMLMLTRNESIDLGVMQEVLPWTWQTFPQWMDTLDAADKGVNVLTYVPLSPLLIYVMGLEAAKTRDATDEERAEMQRVLREAMDAGACGWSAQRATPGSGLDGQRDYDGTPFVTDLMSDKTALALAEVLADYDRAVLQTLVSGVTPEDGARHVEELARASKASVIYNIIATDTRNPDGHRNALAWIASAQKRGLRIYGQCQSSGGAVTFTIADGWNLWDEQEPWREATLGSLEQKLAKFSDPGHQAKMKANPPKVFILERLILLKTYTEKFMKVKGTVLPDAARMMGYDNVLDFFFDLVVADELKTLFQCPLMNDSDALTAEMVTEPFSLWGVSDGGAHQKFLTTGSFTTDSIIKFVREQELVTLEEAHYRLSSLPASVAGFKNRGQLVEGAPADVIVYDYDNLALLEPEVAHDLPTGDWRRIQKAEGYRYTIVNGDVTFEDGVCTKATPGRLLRHGQ
jgi:N-acyl-D-amino-acid deacylase